MKSFIIILSSLFTLNSWADSNVITCMTTGESFGEPTSVQVTITLTDIPGSSHKQTDIVAQGRGFMQFSGTSSISISDESEVEITFFQDSDFGELEMNLLLEGQSIYGQGVQLLGPGTALTSPQGRLKPEYELSNCQGLI